MTDWIDRAQEVEQSVREVSVRSVQRAAQALGHRRPTRFCEDCPEQIELDRLAACPGATRCIECQRRHERLLRTHAR